MALFFGSAAAYAASGELIAFNRTVAVYLSSDHSIPPAVRDAMEREAAALVAPSRIGLVWNDEAASRNTAAYENIAVIHLDGHCDAALPGPFRVRIHGGEPLGQTQVAGGKVLPFADVRCDEVRNVIDGDLRTSPQADRGELLGRALGRVLAHELYHVLLRTTAHGRSGLARPAQTSADLLAPRDPFTPEDERKLSDLKPAEIAAADDAGR